MRCFLAIELPDDVRQHLAAVGETLSGSIRASFTRVENLHITLKFLGEIDERGVDALVESMSMIRQSGGIEMRASGIECFPQRGQIRIVAAGFAGSEGAVRSLHQSIEQRCRHLGFERETRQYRPHVTLARARPLLPPSVRTDAVALTAGQFPGPPLHVQDFVLFRSHLSPAGARYEAIRRFPVTQ